MCLLYQNKQYQHSKIYLIDVIGIDTNINSTQLYVCIDMTHCVENRDKSFTYAYIKVVDVSPSWHQMHFDRSPM